MDMLSGKGNVPEEQVLNALVQLLLSARYEPLTKEEWQMAEEHSFTFDVPVTIQWDAMDPGGHLLI